MQQHYELSDTEYKIMQLFWKNSDPLPFNEILKYCNDELQLNWAVGTAQTYLNRLILKGVLKTNNKRYRKLYSAQLSEEELAQKYARQFVDESFGGSLKNFIASFTQETKLSEADAMHYKYGFYIRKSAMNWLHFQALRFLHFIKYEEIFMSPANKCQ